MNRPPRSVLAAKAIAMRAAGMKQREIAAALGVSRSYAVGLYTDPDGARDRARKASYGMPCRRCGKRTDGSNGAANAPRLCASCYRDPAPCGTPSAYSSGCRCPDCRRAHAEAHRDYMLATGRTTTQYQVPYRARKQAAS